MVKILDRYIAMTTLQLIAAAVLLVMGVDFLFAYIHELGGVGDGYYTAWMALLYTGLTLPRRLYEMFPIAGLLGSLMALGLLASRSELIVMRSSGMSVNRIAGSMSKIGLVLGILVLLLGEFVVPFAEYHAEALKVDAKSGGQAVLTAKGTWIREGNNFVHIRRLLPEKILEGVTRYQFNDSGELKSAMSVEWAHYQDGQWQLRNVKESFISEKQITAQTAPEELRKDLIDPTMLDVLLQEPDHLSLVGLYHYIRYLDANQLNSEHYRLIFWKKTGVPIAVILMITLGVPFIFGPLRQSSMGLRILAGILLGFTFYVANEIFGPLSLVYHFPPLLAALAPLCLFGLLAVYMLRRVR